MPNLLNAALMEAKKWLKDKKKGLNQEIEMECDTGGVDPNMSPNVSLSPIHYYCCFSYSLLSPHSSLFPQCFLLLILKAILMLRLP